MTTRRPIAAGNWKMFKTTAEAASFVEALAQKVKTLKNEALPEIRVVHTFYRFGDHLIQSERIERTFYCGCAKYGKQRQRCLYR